MKPSKSTLIVLFVALILSCSSVVPELKIIRQVTGAIEIHSPGHSPGSVCYLVDGKLFSGDVLFYRTVGRTDIQNSSRGDQIKSVQRLYEILPDSTPVYPGHGQFTDILSEKTQNSRIKADTVTW